MIITIVTATLNADRFLEQAIASVREQRGQGFEVEHVIADGGSTDRTLEIATAAGCTVLSEPDEGLFDAMNKGRRVSRGDVLGFLGADDVLASGALEAIARWFPRRRHSWVAGRQRWVDGNGRSLGTTRPPPVWMTPAMYASLGWSCFDHQATFVTGEFFDAVGGFDPSYRVSGDYHFFAHALTLEKFDRIPDLLCEFRIHGENTSASSGQRTVEENERIAREFGPRSAVLRSTYRQLLRVWMNARNPAWFLGKRLRPELYGLR